MNFKHPKANVLVVGDDYVQCLQPATLITQADALLDAHRLEDAVELADKQLKKIQRQVSPEREEADELRYVFQRIGFRCLVETLFDDAGRHFFSGDLDPRILISYYPELRGSLFTEDDTVHMFEGVAEHMPPENSIDSIIAINLVRNYSPHLAPNTSTAPPTVELRQVLKMAATEMLKVFLRKWRAKWRKEGAEGDVRKVYEVVDTVLAKLYTESGETTDLLALIGGPNDIVLPEVEPLLVSANRYDALCRLYRSRGEDRKLLEIWSKLVTGEAIDEDVRDPLESMFTLLTEKRDKALAQEWGVWLLKWDPDRALKLLTTLGTSKRGAKAAAATTAAEDNLLLLQRIQENDPSAGLQYLEHLVLQKRSTASDLHAQLATTYVEQLIDCLEDETTSKLWRAKAASYASSRSNGPFFSYFASTTPDSESKRIRLKTMLFLQGSKLYDPQTVRQRLEGLEPVQKKLLSLELAVVLGKLGQHREALSTLIHATHDVASAETYCTLGGDVVSQKTAHAVGERFGLQPWAALFGGGASTGKHAAAQISREQTVNEGLKKELTMILLEVYMSGGEAMAESTAQLLNTQAMNLDAIDVISLIPPEWPVRVLSSFLSRSFRRTLHARHEGQLVKAIAASQNLTVADETWVVLREQGAIIEEAGDDDDDGVELDEKGEKIVLEHPEPAVDEETGLGLHLNEKAAMDGYDVQDSAAGIL